MKQIVFESFKDNTTLGSFILIDRVSNSTAGAGTIHFSLMRSQNAHQQYFEINQETREKLLNQKPICIWFTGLSGSGKSTIANAAGEMNIVATDASGGTYYVTKLTAHRATLVPASVARLSSSAGSTFSSGQSARWSFAAASGSVVQIENT